MKARIGAAAELRFEEDRPATVGDAFCIEQLGDGAQQTDGNTGCIGISA